MADSRKDRFHSLLTAIYYLLSVALGAASFFLSITFRVWPETVSIRDGRLYSYFLGSGFGISLAVVWFLPVVVVALLLAFSNAGRELLHWVVGSRRRAVAAGLAVAVFLFTLIPGKPEAQLMVAYLAFAGTGLLLVLYGMHPILSPLAKPQAAAGDFVLRRLSTVWFLLLVCGLCFLLTNLVSWLAFRHVPHVSDSICYVFQGRVLAAGRTWVPMPWDDYFFRFSGIVNDSGRLYAIVPFGHSLFLALGTLLRAEWLINPLLGTLTLLVLYHLGKEAGQAEPWDAADGDCSAQSQRLRGETAEATGRLAALLGLFSPFLIFMSSEYMNHATSLLLTSVFLLFFLRVTRQIGAGEIADSSKNSCPLSPISYLLTDAVLAGLALCLLVNTRPLNALALAVPAAGYGVWLLSCRRARIAPHLTVIGLGALLGLLLFLGYNWLTTGSPLLSGYQAYARLQLQQPNWGIGFGVRGFEAWGSHTPWRGLVQTLTNLNAVNRSLFESPFPGLLLVLPAFLFGPRRTADYFLLAVFLCLPAAYFFYWYQDLCFGPRFLYETLAPVLVLSSRGVLKLLPTADRSPPESTDSMKRAATGRCPGVLLVGGLLSLLTMLAVNLPPLLRFYSRDFWGVGSQIAAEVRAHRVSNAVVFIQSDYYYHGNVWDSYYGAGFLGNTLDFQGPVVYARDQGDENYVLMRNLPGRRYYFADNRSFREITNLDSLSALPKMAALAEAGEFYYNRVVRGVSTDSGRLGPRDRWPPGAGYKTLLLPFREVGTFFAGDSSEAADRPHVTTYTDVSSEIASSGKSLSDYLPALAVFFPLDRRSYLSVFRSLAEPQNFIADGCRFTRVFTSTNGVCNVFDIRPATGNEHIAR
jgi:hypothetical protein